MHQKALHSQIMVYVYGHKHRNEWIKHKCEFFKLSLFIISLIIRKQSVTTFSFFLFYSKGNKELYIVSRRSVSWMGHV